MSGLVTADYQWELDGLLMGAGTPYAVTSFTGFNDMAPIRGGGTARARQHGFFSEPNFSDGATYELMINVIAGTAVSFTAARLALEAGTYPQAATRPLWFQLPEQDMRLVNVQVAQRKLPGSQEFGFGIIRGALQFTAPDPLKYGYQQVAVTGLPTSSGGLTYPLVYPLNYGPPSTAGRLVVSNYGTAPMAPVFTVAGPIDAAGFAVTSIEDAATVSYLGAVGVNDTLVFDCRTGIATLNGSLRAAAYTILPTVPPDGARTFAFNALGAYSSAAALTITSTPGYW